MATRSPTPAEDWMAESDEELDLGEDEDEGEEVGEEEDEDVAPPSPIVLSWVVEPTTQEEGDDDDDIRFNWTSVPAQQPDVQLMVFDQEFRVHSEVLSHYSVFFERFLDSPEKEGLIDRSVELPYKWRTLVDDDGAWSVVWDWPGKVWKDHKPPIDVEVQIAAFKTLLEIFYEKNVTLNGVRHLKILTEMADYYLCTPIVGYAVDKAIPRSPRVLWYIETNAADLLPIAYRLQCSRLWNDCLIYVVGAWRTPIPKYSSKRITRIIKALRAKLHGSLQVLQTKLNNSINEKEDIDALRIFKQFRLDRFDEFLNSPIPKLCKDLLEMRTSETMLSRHLRGMLLAGLEFNQDGHQPGVGQWEGRLMGIRMDKWQRKPWLKWAYDG